MFIEVHGTFQIPSEKIAFVKVYCKVSTRCIYYNWTILFDGSCLTYFSPVSHFYTPWKRQKTKGFLTLSGGIEMWHY